MSENTAVTTERTPVIIANEINTIKSQTRVIMLQASIEIGRRLVEAKAMVIHGEWGKWLQESVDYSQSTAQNLMRIYEEYGNDQTSLFDSAKSQTFGNLTYSQAVALLGIPVDERAQFVEENDVENMSTRELQAAIKERDELKAKLEKSRETTAKIVDERDKYREEASTLRSDVSTTNRVLKETQGTVKMLQESLEKERQRTKDEQDRLVKLLEEARAAGGDPEKVKALESKLAEAQAKVKQLEEEVARPVEIETAVIEKVPEEVERELAELREKLKSGQQHNTAVVKFSVCFDVLVKNFKDLLGALGEIKDTTPESYEKYSNAVISLLDKMSERL